MHGIDQSLDTGSYSQRDSLDEGGTAAGAPREGPLLAGAVVKDDWCDGTQPSEDGLSSYPVALENSSDECDEEEGYEGVTPRAESDSYSEVEDSADTEVVFVKEGVVVWPSRSERILGRLSLIKQHGMLFLAWLPYTPGSLLEDGSYHAAAGEMAQSMQSAKERTLYTVHPIPLTDIKAIHKHTPPLGNHKITITLASGVSLAPLYFQQGGIKAFFSALREHVPLLRSADDPGTYLVNDTAEPLQRCLTSMELTDVLLGGPPAGASSTFPPASGSLAQEGWQAAEAEVPLRAQVLDLVDRFSRSLLTAKVAASSFFANGLLPQFDDMLSPEDDYHPDKARHAAGAGATPAPAAGEPCPQQQPQHGRQQRQPASQLGLPPGATLAASFSSSQPELAGAGGKGAPGCGAPLESGVFSVDGVPLRDEDVAEQQQQQQEQQQGGEGQAAQQQQQEVEEEGDNGAQAASTELGVFEVIERSNAGLTTSALWTRARPPPLSLEELNTFCDREGRLVDEASFRQRVFYGGVEPEARPLAWKWLLGLLPPGAGREERREREARQLQQYLCLRQQWQSIGKEQAARFAKWRERRARIEKDVRRTDRGVKLFSKERGEGQAMLRGLLLTYSLYNFDLGYVQGMSDLAAPILYVMRSQVSGPALSREEMRSIEAQAFWCFARLMDRMESNFSTDCTGMHAQLVALRRLVQLLDPPLYAHLEAHDCLNMYFAYRWCLLHFKRELPSFEEVLRLWEALWTGYPTPQLHLYICVAVFEHHRRKIMSEDLDFDGMLKFCVELSGRLDLPALLRDAEVLCNYAGEAGRECVAGLPVLPHMHGAAAAAGVPAAPASPPPAQSGGLVTVVGPGADMAAGRAGGRATGALQA